MSRQKYSQGTVESLWKLIRPQDDRIAGMLAPMLEILASTDKEEWYHHSFLVAKTKKPGLYRRITPATTILAVVQYFITRWIEKEFDLGTDYVYKGGVLPAVKMHQGAAAAFKFDLESAYDYVTDDKLKFYIRAVVPSIRTDALEFLVDLLTYDGSTPQGCTSTPAAYNILAARMDIQIELAMQVHHVYAITRYSDDILVSFEGKCGISGSKLEKAIKGIVSGAGFKVGNYVYYEAEPFEYLGTLIYSNKLLLVDEKYEEIIETVELALNDKSPKSHRKRITGLLVWTAHISGDKIPSDILSLFKRYFDKVGSHPQVLTELSGN